MSRFHLYFSLIAEKQNLSLKLSESQAALAGKYATEKIIFGGLKGYVSVKDDKKIGASSIHFDEVNGPYISHENHEHSKSKFDNGNVIPSRLLFSEFSYDETTKKISGRINYAGNSIRGFTSIMYEMCFDTEYLCVASGRIVYANSDKSEKSEVFGEDNCYTNTNLETVNKETEKQLRLEGASEKSIGPVLRQFSKYRLCLVTIYDLVVRPSAYTHCFLHLTRFIPFIF